MTASSSDLLVVYVRPMRLLVCTVNAAALSSNAVASTSNAVAWRSVRLVPTSTNASLDDTGDNDDEEDGDGGDDGDASNESNDVRSIALNADASLLLLSGARGCHVVELNQRFYHELRRFNSSSSGSSSVNSTSMPLFDCRCFALGEYWHATHSSVRVVDARWHPLALDRCAVLTSDNALRIYDAGAPARAAECESMHRVLLPAAAQPLVAFAFGHDGVSKEAWREGWGMMAAYFLTADTRLFALCPVVPRSCVLPVRLLAELAQLTHQHDDDTAVADQSEYARIWLRRSTTRVVASAVRARPDESALDWVRFDAADGEPLLLQGPLWSSSGADLRAVALECVSGGSPAALVVAQSNGVLNAVVGIEPLQPRWRLTSDSRIAAIAASTTLHTYERLDMALDVPLPMRASHAVVLQRIGGVDDALVALHGDGAHVVRLRWLGTLRRWCQEALIGGGEQRSLALPDAPASLVRGVLLGGALRGAATLLSLAGTDDVFIGLSSNTGLGAVPLQLDQRERTRAARIATQSSAGEPAAESDVTREAPPPFEPFGVRPPSPLPHFVVPPEPTDYSAPSTLSFVAAQSAALRRRIADTQRLAGDVEARRTFLETVVVEQATEMAEIETAQRRATESAAALDAKLERVRRVHATLLERAQAVLTILNACQSGLSDAEIEWHSELRDKERALESLKRSLWRLNEQTREIERAHASRKSLGAAQQQQQQISERQAAGVAKLLDEQTQSINSALQRLQDLQSRFVVANRR